MSNKCSHGPHAGHHHHAPTQFHTAFAVGALLNTGFVAVEFFFGWWSHSLALIADAAHNLGDVLALLFAWLGYYLAQQKPAQNSRFTYGLGRVSIFATVFNGLTLIVSSLWIIYEAVQRFGAETTPMPLVIGTVAAVGIVINGATAWLLAKGQDDVNIKGAMLHMVADALISVGVVACAALIAWTGALWIDPAVSIVIAVLIVWGGWPVLREGLLLALDAVPGHLNRAEIDTYMRNHPDLRDVHSLHVWALSTSKTALSAHISPQQGVETDLLLRRLESDLRSKFNLSHTTLQIENDPQNCRPKTGAEHHGSH